MKLFSHLSANGIKLEEYRFKRENIMEAYIQENESVLALQEDDSVEIKGNQLDWLKDIEKKGRIDILALYNGSTLAIVELKAGSLTEADFNQLKGYFNNEGFLKKVVDKYKEETGGKVINNWIGVLVGTDIDPEFSPVKVTDSKYSFNVLVMRRFRSDSGIFVASEVVLFDKKGNKDNTKYRLDNVGCYSKNKLVLNLVKKYLVKKGNAVTVEMINKDLFDGIYTIPSIPFLKEVDRIPDKHSDSYQSKKDDPIQIGGVLFAICNGWTIKEMPQLIKNAERLDFKIEEAEEE